MKEIPLTQGKVALVDDQDFENLSKHKWYALEYDHTFYAARNVTGADGNQTRVRMHRELLGLTDPEIEGDHKDCDGLNNQRHNLRKASRADNKRNTRKRTDNTSGFKGVCWDKQNNKWRAMIRVGGKLLNLGRYQSAEDAQSVYWEAAKKFHGEFARAS
jgi:hypothetical protein